MNVYSVQYWMNLTTLNVCFLWQLEKARTAFHKACRKEHMAREREAHAQGNPDIAIEKQRKIQEETELAHQETEKVSVVWGKLSERERENHGEFQWKKKKEAEKNLHLLYIYRLHYDTVKLYNVCHTA